MNRRDAKLYEQHKSRYVLLGALAVFFALLFAGRLANLQIVNGASYREQSERRVYRTVTVAAPRGGIYDRYGRALVVNRMAFSVQDGYKRQAFVDVRRDNFQFAGQLQPAQQRLTARRLAGKYDSCFQNHFLQA